MPYNAATQTPHFLFTYIRNTRNYNTRNRTHVHKPYDNIIDWLRKASKSYSSSSPSVFTLTNQPIHS